MPGSCSEFGELFRVGTGPVLRALHQRRVRVAMTHRPIIVGSDLMTSCSIPDRAGSGKRARKAARARRIRAGPGIATFKRHPVRNLARRAIICAHHRPLEITKLSRRWG